MPKLFIVVPVFNEAGNITTLLEAFRGLCDKLTTYQIHIIAINDGSSDNTGELLEEHGDDLPLKVIAHPTNRGPGVAFATAFTYLANHMTADDWVITIEGDNTSRHELIETMLRRAIEENYDSIFASPYLYGGGVINTTSLRIILSKIANTFVKELLGLTGIMTVSSFFRLYRASALMELQKVYGAAIIERNGFECMIELTLKMMYLRQTISEVAMVLDTSRRHGKSKMKIIRTIRGYLTLYFLKRNWQLDNTEDKQAVRL